jgi:hypothetical protein
LRAVRTSIRFAFALLLMAPSALLAQSDADGTQRLSGRKLKLDQARDGIRLHVTSRNAALSIGEGPGSEDDPTLFGGALRVVSGAGFFEAAIPLPASGWQRTRDGYVYEGAAPPLRIRLRAGRGLRIAGLLEEPAALPLADPGPVGLELRTGARRYCLQFGGSVRYAPGEKLAASDAAAPAECVGLPGSARVFGGVVAAIPGEPSLPDAAVRLEVDAATVAERVSDADGRFHFEPTVIPPWAGRVCARRDGFAEACENVELPRPEGARLVLALAPLARALVGRVLLANGEPCFDAPSLLGPGVRGEAGLLASPSLSARADRAGQFVLPGAPTGAVPLLARCGAAELESVLSVEPADLDGGRVFDLGIPNQPPEIEALIARDAYGNAVRHAGPGETLSVSARTSDPDGDALEILWFDDATGDRLGSGDAIEWQLLASEALNQLRVSVSDGRGGTARDLLSLRTGDPRDRILGRVEAADGRPIDGARVQVDDSEELVTAADGSFRALVPPRGRHVLRVDAPGRGRQSKLVHGSAVAEVVIRVPDATIAEIDPNAPISLVSDPATGASASLIGGTLVDASGAPATGPVQISFHPYDMSTEDPPPGDGVARADPGADVAPGVRLVAAVAIHASDARGESLRLAAGARVLVELPQPARGVPVGIEVVAFDPGDGTWVSTEYAFLPSAGTLKFTTDAIGDIGPAVKLPETTCRRFRADVGSVTLPLEVFVYRHTGFGPGGEPRYEEFHASFTVSDYQTTYALLGLEPGAYYFWSALPTSGERNGSVLPQPLTDRFRAPLTPSAGFPVEPDYGACAPYLGGGLRRFFLEPFTGEGSFVPTGAEPAKATYAGWLAANGFAFATQLASARFYNRAELGLGRSVLCFRNGKRLACAIQKYGTPGGPVAGALDDMVHATNPGEIVTIDTDAPGAPVRFYNYGPDGKRKSDASFGGAPGAVPAVCDACHQGGIVPIDPNTHVYPASEPRAAQADALRRLNAMLYPYLVPTAQQFVDQLYPGGVHTPGAVAIELVPSSYAAADKVATYTKAVRDHCKLCHMQTGWDWTKLSSLSSYPDVSSVFTCKQGVIRTDLLWMPYAWVPQRNVFQHPIPYQLLRGTAQQPEPPCAVPNGVGFDQAPAP